MVKNSLYILIASLLLVSCDDNTSNVDDTGSSRKSFNSIRQVDYNNAKAIDTEILIEIESKCKNQENGLAILIGDDENNNGILEYQEAYHTGSLTVLCNGQNGQISLSIYSL